MTHANNKPESSQNSQCDSQLPGNTTVNVSRALSGVEGGVCETLEPADCEVANGGSSRGSWLNISVSVVISHDFNSS